MFHAKDAVNMASKNQVGVRRSPDPRRGLADAVVVVPDVVLASVAAVVVVPDVVLASVAADAPVALAVVVPDVAPVDPSAVASTV